MRKRLLSGLRKQQLKDRQMLNMLLVLAIIMARG